MPLSGNIYVWNDGQYVYVQAENCGDAATLTHNVFASKEDAETLHIHDDHIVAGQNGNGAVDMKNGKIVSQTGWQHGVPVGQGSANNPQYATYRLRLGEQYGAFNPKGRVPVQPGAFLRIGFRYMSHMPIPIPKAGDVTVVSYAEMTFDQGHGRLTEAHRGPRVPARLGQTPDTQTIANLMLAGKEGVMVRGELRIVPKAAADGRLHGWEVWFDNHAPALASDKLKTGYTGTVCLINPRIEGEDQGTKNAGLGLESMAVPRGGSSAMQYIRAGGDYGRDKYGIEAVPGAHIRAGVRGYSSLVAQLPALEKGELKINLQEMERGSAIDNMAFFDTEELEKKLAEKKNRVRFFRDGVGINDQLPEVIYKGAEAFQKSDVPAPRVSATFIADSEACPGGGWKLTVSNPLPASMVEPKECADALGKLAYPATLSLSRGEATGADPQYLQQHVFTTPNEVHEWFLPAGQNIGGVVAEAGAQVGIATGGMGWRGAITLPTAGAVDTHADEASLHAAWELWETQHERGSLYPEDLGVVATIAKQGFLERLNLGTAEQLLEQARQKTAGRPDQARILGDLESLLTAAEMNGTGLVGDNLNELQRLWKSIDDLDRNGNAASVTETRGTGYEPAWALMAEDGQGRIAQIASNVIGSSEAARWGQESGDFAPVYNPAYSGGGPNRAGDMRAPGFLDGNWKCSVFVSEAMFRARFMPPYSAYGVGDPRVVGRHYEVACLFHTHTRHANGQEPLFASVASLPELRPGDVISFQRWGDERWNTNGDGGHVMVVTRIDDGQVQVAEAAQTEARFNTLAARLSREPSFTASDDVAQLLAQATQRADQFGTFFEMAESVRVRFLRPTRRV